jgi:glycosyltransferase involved in cell wall biosynthesis
LRILINTVFLTSERLGGSWAYTANLVSFITRLQSPHHFTIIANREVADRLLCDPDRSTKVVVDIDADSKLGRVAWEQWSIPRIVTRLGIDLVHSTGNVLPLLLRVPSVVTLHDLQYLEYPRNFSPLRRAYLRLVVPASVRRASAVIADSEFAKSSICRLLGTAGDKIHVVHLGGITEDLTSSSATRVDVEQKFQLTRPFFLSVGSSLPHKNLPRLIEAFAEVAADIPYDLVIVGENFSYKQLLEQCIGAAGLSGTGRVRLLGFVSRADLISLYRHAEAYVFPSLYEGFGIPALEAMDCGCPVLAARCTSLPEVIGEAGLLFEPTDVHDIARCLKTFYHDPAIRISLIEKGSRRAKEFSWERMARETLHVYEQLASTQNGTFHIPGA